MYRKDDENYFIVDAHIALWEHVPKSAQAVIDFVGEGGATRDGVPMLRRAGDYHVVGYGENIRILTPLSADPGLGPGRAEKGGVVSGRLG
ncbi:hypothetical protein [Saccharopolyspora pogona]|uniref:hypothetical protein n=1 Tax=Saccharopolyspora pogona TaxID=333966 RepID=UPI001CC24F7E|nr:hypothetical protein [Saccharopolyspora pogona]